MLFVNSFEGILARRWRRFVFSQIVSAAGSNLIVRKGVTVYDGRDLYVGNNVSIGNDSYFSGGEIVIGDNVRIARQLIVETYNHGYWGNDYKDGNYPVFIQDNVWIGDRVTICPGVTVGEGSVLAAGAVVTKDVPPYSLAGGAPAKIIRRREDKMRFEMSADSCCEKA